jgi:hypothetical protein
MAMVVEDAGELVSYMPLSLLTLHFSTMCFPLWPGGACIRVHVWNKKLKVLSGVVLISALQQQMGTDEIKLNIQRTV